MDCNPFALLKAAAIGSLDAQRALAEMAVNLASTRTDCDPVSILRDGLCFARLAAAQGDDGDEGRVISMLALVASFGSEDEQADPLGEALARYSILAERGLEVPGVTLEQLVECLPRDAVGVAGQLQSKIREGAAA
jgi:hypothetical protein